jgi:predicted Zn-dependent peptidase
VKLSVTALLIGLTAFAAEPDLRIPFEKYKLANGLRVILARDTSVPVAAVYMLYDVGARTEEKGSIGFAHLFEHMMFEGSANVKRGEFAKYIQSNGGELNASTHLDYTEYYETLPSNKLPLALWLESDRMRAPAISEDNLKSLKESIANEKRRDYDTQPYRGIISNQWPGLIFSDPHDTHSVIGALDDLNAATVDDVTRFFRTYYAPNNAVLVISGDFTSADARKLVDRYFADIPSQPQPRRAALAEPARAAGKQLVAADPVARVPALIVGWPAPRRHTPDWYALNMLDAVLTAGKNSRLAAELVNGRQSVLQLDANLGWPSATPQDFKDPAYYAALIIHKPTFLPKEIVEQYQQVLDSIAGTGLDSGELRRARAVLRFARLNGLLTALDRARTLGIYELMDGDAGLIDRDFTNLMAVTGDQVQAVAKKYLSAERRDLLEIRPAAGAAK